MQRFRVLAVISVIILLGLAAVLYAGRYVVMRSATMVPANTSAAAFAAASPGSSIKLVAEVTSANPDGSLDLRLLSAVANSQYRRTSTRITADLPTGTMLIMGKRADIKPGSVLQLAGTLDARHTIRAREVVFLTGYVQVSSS